MSENRHEVVFKGNFYSMRESDILAHGSICSCDRFDCFSCCCGRTAIKLGLQEETEEKTDA